MATSSFIESETGDSLPFPLSVSLQMNVEGDNPTAEEEINQVSGEEGLMRCVDVLVRKADKV